MTETPPADAASTETSQPQSADALFSAVYERLKAMAGSHLARNRGAGSTLDTTALVHETYLKLVDQSRASWESRAHFLATAAKAMRHILINYARDRRAQKRGGGDPKLSLEELGDRLEGAAAMSEDNAELLIALDAALEALAQVNERQSRIVECRFFGSLTIEETAAALGISTATVSRGWALAQVRLFQDVRRQIESERR